MPTLAGARRYLSDLRAALALDLGRRPFRRDLCPGCSEAPCSGACRPHLVTAEEVGRPWDGGSPWGQVRLTCRCGWSKVVDAGVEVPVQDHALAHITSSTKEQTP